MGGFLRVLRTPEINLMSHADYASRPVPVLTKLAAMLRKFPAVQFVIAKFTALQLNDRSSVEVPIRKFFDDTRGTISVDQPVIIWKSPGDIAIAAPKPNDDPSERERLIRRRWAETGVRLWNPNFHGAGLAALGIQGRAELLAPNPGELLPRYDRLEFELIEGRIFCEGVAVDPPKRLR
jgi:hypothetical protein